MFPGTMATMLMKTSMHGPLYSDTALDLWLLYEFAGRVQHITEFGVRAGVSTSAFMAAQPDFLRSYDIEPCPNYNTLRMAADRTDWKFVLQSSLEADIEPTDLLFIDSLHTYAQLRAELEQHHEKVSTYIMLHDTISCGTKDEFGNEPGLLAAYRDFVEANPQWQLYLASMAQNGLTILKRRGA